MQQKKSSYKRNSAKDVPEHKISCQFGTKTSIDSTPTSFQTCDQEKPLATSADHDPTQSVTGFLPTYVMSKSCDESRFSLSLTTAHVSGTGQRSDPAFIVERHTAISQGVTVWGAIFGTHEVVLQGTLKLQYVDDILTPICYPCYQVAQVPFIG
ncbi:hypothetical protein TNCV_292461 [Trichonephila clavipes]|nr:hypothetical protein TNCV_292461 [Trichonephila clavipes]